jgi:hypothetical protein
VLLVTISGNDVGEFGSAPLVEITPDAKRGHSTRSWPR